MRGKNTPDNLRATIFIRPKAGILDPQGEAVERALRTLGFDVSHVRIGRLLDLTIKEVAEGTDRGKLLAEMSDKASLHNPLIETREIRVEEPVTKTKKARRRKKT
jgi:phosphoribosylformylglycinamidine synthase